MSKKLKIGFIMGGGVSMGSFSAGALEYVLHALEKHLNTSEYEECKVDIFTGASAGSVTLTLAIFDRLNKQPNKENENWLKKLWTDEKWLDIANLAKGIKKQKKIALFSDEVIYTVTSELKKEIDYLENSEKSILADDIYLGMTMTNLNGIPRDLTELLVNKDGITANLEDGKDALMNYSSADYRYFKITTKNSKAIDEIVNRYNIVPINSITGWGKILETAIASGAFPGAFPSVRIKRSNEEYGRRWPYSDDSHQTYTYSDGGAFNNDPIDHALHMAGELDKEDLARKVDFDRLFIFIDPIVGKHDDRRDPDWIKKNVPYDFGQDTSTQNIHEGFKKLVSSYMRILLHQGSYKHFNKVDKINNHIDWLKDFVNYLLRIVELLPENHPEIKSITTDIKTKMKTIISLKYERTNGIKNTKKELNYENYIDKQVALIKSKYPNIMGTKSDKNQLMLHLIALIENVSGLRNKQKVNFIAIGADQSKVLGDEHEGFKGFFNHQWRKHDYQEGKKRAYQILKDIKSNNSLFINLTAPSSFKIDKKEEVLTSNRNKRHLNSYLKDLIYVLRQPLNRVLKFISIIFSRRIRKRILSSINFERKNLKKEKE